MCLLLCYPRFLLSIHHDHIMIASRLGQITSPQLELALFEGSSLVSLSYRGVAHLSASQVVGTPHLHNLGFKNPCGDIEQCRTPYKVSTTSPFGAPNGVVLQCSMSPQRVF